MFDIIVFVLGVVAGYGFRGLIGRELRSVTPQVKNEVAVIMADAKVEFSRMVADAVAAVKKV